MFPLSPDCRVLTVCAPFAHLIVNGRKRIENRPRRTNYRGPVLIHSGKRRSYGGCSAEHWGELFGVNARDLTFGAIVGIAVIVDCVPLDRLPASLQNSPHAIGPWCWVMVDPVRFAEPIPLAGKLGLFRPDPFTLRRAGDQMARAFNGATEVSTCG